MAVMLTPSATRFVGPLSFAALSRHPVETDVLDLLPDGRIGHIVVADSGGRDRRRAGDRALAGRDGERPGRRRRDRDVPGDVRAGRRRAGDGRRDVDAIRPPSPTSRGCATTSATRSSSPRSGPLASGQTGIGRLAELGAIVDAVVAAVGDRPVRAPGSGGAPAARRRRRATPTSTGRHIVVTAGGTREAIDPVRFIGNRSTGRMGVADRRGRARPRGAGDGHRRERRGRRCPPAATVVRVESTADLRAALLRATQAPDGAAGFDALVMAAAVADFRPIAPRRYASSRAATA